MKRNNDDNILLNSYLNTVLFNNNNSKFIDSVELIIRPECNQKCEYCYIYKYGDKLYPSH
jgi:DNA repair photolyase